MSNSRIAQREAFRLVPETCPHVDWALSAAADAIKEQTGALRAALIDAITEREDAQDRVSELESEVAELKAEIESLRAEGETA